MEWVLAQRYIEAKIKLIVVKIVPMVCGLFEREHKSGLPTLPLQTQRSIELCYHEEQKL